MSSTSSSKRNRPGRPRLDGKPLRTRKAPLPWAIRPRIKKMIDDGATPAMIMLKFKTHKPTRQQIDAIRNGRMKLYKAPRKDSFEISASPGDVLYEGTIPDKIEYALHRAMDDIKDSTHAAPNRFAMLTKAGQIYKSVISMRLMSRLGRRDAEVIVALVRLFVPDATEEAVIGYYKQAEMLVTNASKTD